MENNIHFLQRRIEIHMRMRMVDNVLHFDFHHKTDIQAIVTRYQ